MTNELTPGAIRAIYDGDPNCKAPVLQVLNVKKIATTPERYRLIISDGQHFMQAMLGTQMNDRVTSGQVTRNSIVVLTTYICNTVQNRRIAIILNIDLVSGNVAEKIGNPQSIDPGSGAADNGNAGAQQAQAPPQQAPQHQQQSLGKPAPGPGPGPGQQRPSNAPPTAGGAYGQNQTASYDQSNGNAGSGASTYGQRNTGAAPETHGQYNSSNTYDQAGRGYGQQGNNGTPGFHQPAATAQNPQQRQTYGNPGHSSASPTGPVYPIKGLSPYQSRWTIRARVTFKSEIKEYSNARGAGKLFNVNLLDDSGEIKATGFNEAVDTFYDLLQENKVYFISGAKVNMARRQFSNIQNDYELGLERNTSITLCTDTSSVPTLQYTFVPLNELDNYEKDSMIDVLGVVNEDHGLSEIISKTTQKPIKKRELSVVDSSQFTVRLTLWGRQAETFDGAGNPVIACKGVKVSDFGGRSLSMFSSSSMTMNPDTSESHSLRGWYDSQGQGANYRSHMAGAATAGGVKNDERKTLQEVKDAGLGEGDKPDYFTAKATIVFFKQDNISYPACPSENCNKKVTEENGQWRCERCQRSYEAPDHRYILGINVSDHTGQVWLQCFNEIGQVLLGRPAGDLLHLRNESEQDFDNVFSAANFKEYLFKCRAKSEVFNDQSRVRYSVLSATPVDYVEESRWQLQTIEKYK